MPNFFLHWYLHGYTKTPLERKLWIKEGFSILLIRILNTRQQIYLTYN